MGGLAEILELLMDKELAERLKNSRVIELDYTARLKDGDSIVIELRCNGGVEALTYRSSDDGSEFAHDMLKREAQAINDYLRRRIDGFDAKFLGYYFLGNLQKQRSFGALL